MKDLDSSSFRLLNKSIKRQQQNNLKMPLLIKKPKMKMQISLNNKIRRKLKKKLIQS